MSDVFVDEITQQVVIEEPLSEVIIEDIKQFLTIEDATDVQTLEITSSNFVVVSDTAVETVEISTPQIEVVEVGIQGPAGINGTGDAHYEQEFGATAILNVPHNLNKYPAVTLVDSAGTEMIGDISHVNNNQLVVTFTAAFGGKVFCN